MKKINCFFWHFRYSDLESRMKDELMNVKIKFTEQSQIVAELRQEISRLETKVRLSGLKIEFNFKKKCFFS